MSTNSELMSHIIAVQQATEIIKNAYRFMQSGEADPEEMRYLCAVTQDHVDTLTISTEIPSQMRSYEMVLESAKEFALIPEGATPIETADILKEMLAPPKLIRRQAGIVDTQFVQAPVPGYNYETRMRDPSNTYNAIFEKPKRSDNRNIDIDIRSIMSPLQQNEDYCLAPRKLFSDECAEGGTGEGADVW